MTLKQFLKPDWRKIALTTALGLFTYALMISGICFQATCVGCQRQCPPIHSISMAITAVTAFPWYITDTAVIWSITNFDKNLPSVLFQTIDMTEMFFWDIPNLLIRLFLSITYLYILSCLIIWIYYKVKKK